jgi:hypothetical protein
VDADTRLVYHLSVLSKAIPGHTVIIRATDIDIMVFLLYHARQLKVNVSMDLGHSSDNARRYVHITALANHLGSVLYKALPNYHPLTGCDYTSSFFRKGKVGPLKKLKRVLFILTVSVALAITLHLCVHFMVNEHYHP